ncbi:MAG: heme exporter protein CcmB [Gammaproteobacteria bacterium]|nr:heme exporter protein CcmB [Gammaproteobacteria bacterium]
MSARQATTAVLHRDLRRGWRRRGDVAQPLIFFALVVYLFPIAIGPLPETLRALLPAILWVAAVLATVLTLPEVFAADHADGSLELLLTSPHPLALLVLGKIAAHWCTGAAPLLAMSAALGAILGLDAPTLAALLGGMALGTPVLALVGSLASALTVGLRGGTLLLALITLPLYIPVLIFGTAAARNAALGLPVAAEMFFLAGLSVLALTLTPFAIAAALRARLD